MSAKRKFYIIAHNPNNISDVLDCLDRGANAIEPDVHWNPSNGEFNVYDWDAIGAPTLGAYLWNLANQLGNRNLALIAFDLKDNNFDFQEMQKIIHDNFTWKYGSIPMLFTCAGNKDVNADINFLRNYVAPYLLDNQGVGLDRYNYPVEVNNSFRDRGFPYTYAMGTFSPFTAVTDYLPEINTAIGLRDQGDSFCLVYSWVVESKSHMEDFIGAGVDGLITSDDHLGQLHDLITGMYSQWYEIATREYNPFNPRIDYGDPYFKVKTYKFIPHEMFVAVNHDDGNSTLLKIKDEGSNGNNMFDIHSINNDDYARDNINIDWLQGTQVFHSYIDEIVYGYDVYNSQYATMIALADGRILKIKQTGGIGPFMFNVIENHDGFYSFPNKPEYRIGDERFKHRVTCLKFYDVGVSSIHNRAPSFTFVCLNDGKLLKISGMGGSGHNMFAVTEQTGNFLSVQGYSYYFGDFKFLDFVHGMEYIKGFLFIYFNNGRLLKINGLGGGGSNLFNLNEDSNLNSHSPFSTHDANATAYYHGDQKFDGNILTLVAFGNGGFSPLTMFIGFNNNKILKIKDVGGGGHNMFGLSEYDTGFTALGTTSYSGHQYLQSTTYSELRCINSIHLIAGYLYIGMTGIYTVTKYVKVGHGADTDYVLKYYHYPFGSILKILGMGISGGNMFNINLFAIDNYTSGGPQYSGHYYFVNGITGLNCIMNKIFIELNNGELLKINGNGFDRYDF